MPGVSEVELAEAAQLASLADETPEGRSIVVLAKTFGIRERELGTHEFVPVHGADADERHRLRRRRGCARARATRSSAGSRTTAARRRPSSRRVLDRIAREGGTPLAVARDSQVLGVVYLKDTVKDGMSRALRPAARDGHPHDHGHRRQPPDRGQDRRGGGRRRLPRRGHPGAQARADPRGAGQRPARGDDRRRHQRRARARAGRRRRGDEHRHPGRARGRQHGRPRLQPDEADRDRRGRQAAPDHPRRADDVLDRQRRRQVLRDPARDLRRHLRGRRAVEGRWRSST